MYTRTWAHYRNEELASPKEVDTRLKIASYALTILWGGAILIGILK